MTTHVHLYSLGAGSWNATRVVMKDLPRADHRLLFTDTLYEDADAYRFGLQGALQLFQRDISWVPAAEDFPDYRVDPSVPIEDYAGNPAWRSFLEQIRRRALEEIPELSWVVEGRDIWEIFRDRRFLGNTRRDPCSDIAKRKPRAKWLAANCNPAETIVYVGIGDDEAHRFDDGKGGGFGPRMAAEGWTARAPLMGRIEGQVSSNLYVRNAGLEPARLYGMGYFHNNCGGMCCKAGRPAVLHHLREQPERAAYDAMMEAKIIAFLGKPVAMLQVYAGADQPRVPMTRAELHAADVGQAQGELFYEAGDSGCGCALDA